jgi:hypothetical protein
MALGEKYHVFCPLRSCGRSVITSARAKFAELEGWMKAKEGKNFEFKEAKNDYDIE